MPRIRQEPKEPLQVSLTADTRRQLRAFTGVIGNTDSEKARHIIAQFLMEQMRDSGESLFKGKRRKR
jgi:hypothetical protein